MKRHEALKIISEYLNEDDLVVSSTGNLSRELFALADSNSVFYMMGSMGLASSIALGLVICLPNRKIIAIEGDGSFLMCLGSVATIGHYAPSNLIHIVLDNEAYDSTGGQPSVSDTANLDKVAGDVGYKTIRRVDNRDKLEEVLRNDMRLSGPVFIQIKVELGGISDKIPRIPYEPIEITNRFKMGI